MVDDNAVLRQRVKTVGSGKAGARGVLAFLRKTTHWGHYVAILAIGISLHSLVTHLGWVVGLVYLPVMLYVFFRWKRAYQADRAP